MHKTQHQVSALGIDFGTTNSSVALATGNSQVQLVSFPFRGAETTSFRSVLYLERRKKKGGLQRLQSWTGPAAIERYLEADDKGGLIQSLKSHTDGHGGLWPSIHA